MANREIRAQLKESRTRRRSESAHSLSLSLFVLKNKESKSNNHRLSEGEKTFNRYLFLHGIQEAKRSFFSVTNKVQFFFRNNGFFRPFSSNKVVETRSFYVNFIAVY